MTTSIPDINALFRFSEVAYDAAQIFGSTTDQALARVKRCLNRAAIDIAGNDRRWGWLQSSTPYQFNTVALQINYSLRQDVKIIHQVWISDLNRQRLDRIPTTKFVELVPNPQLATGIPRLYDLQGVDSNAAPIISLYPMPASVYQMNVRYTKQIVPVLNDTADIRVAWGMPENLLTALTQKAAAYALQGVNNAKFMELNQLSEMLIKDAYDAEQSRLFTHWRAPMSDTWDMLSEGPMLPATYGYGSW